jgi:hypothetical protein
MGETNSWWLFSNDLDQYKKYHRADPFKCEVSGFYIRSEGSLDFSLMDAIHANPSFTKSPISR